MPLTECPNCGKVISNMAIKCPYCGFDVADYWEWEKKQGSKSEADAGPEKESVSGSASGEQEKIDIEENGTDAEEDNENIITEKIEYDAYNKTYMTDTNSKTSSYKKEYIKPLKMGLIIIAAVFAILAAVFFYKGFDVKNNYYHNDSYSILDQNAYVGGDAYNMIINGTYFTGYVVIGTGCMICAVISGLGLIIVGAKERDQELMEQLNNRCKRE